MGSATGAGRRRARPTFEQKFQVCERLRECHRKFREGRYTYAEAAAELGGLCGFAVSQAVLRSAISTTGLDWWPQRPDRGRCRNSLVWQLYEAFRAMCVRLGEPVPEGLQAAAANVLRARAGRERAADS